MQIEVRVPVLPESVAEATLLNWRKAVGESVQRDEILIEVETDKVVLEVVAEKDGVMRQILAANGETVAPAQVIAIIETDIAAPAANRSDARADRADDPSIPRRVAESPTDDPLSPAVRKLVIENGLDPAKIEGTGKDGRVTKADVIKFLESRGKAAATIQPTAPEGTSATSLAQDAPRGSSRPQERVPMSRIRQRIAERLVEAQHTAAILTTFNEVNMQSVMELRAHHGEEFEKAQGVRLGFMSFFVKAAVAALKKFPEVNAFIDGTDIVYHGYYDIGIAVSAPRGLVVPILRDADQLTFAEIELKIRDLGARAQDNKIALDELQGGTFSISNGGTFGSMLSTPILNPPQSAILGMHNILDRPVAVDGQVVIRPMMYLALSYDHRIIDGRGAVTFLVTIKQALEDPARLLLQL